ncbi:DUF4083 domain-containing protein [Mesobacillus stamsii]|uniref:F0F1-type ATP synthase assembly protein I n=1 Tax=Mesobacillus stamsii TaxID=225347 RepID=A0ABU0FZJ1_9BACI|nr:DUF4083 domain-containing protein [Mesobacillus stamsii]MDQ0414986.1 F0F1-type ATP synthase assembly protein I [Mesobacillus stamsii]
MNIGDVVYQLIMFIILLGMIFGIYYLVRSIVKGSKNSNFKNIEQKLDKIIDLLEKEKKE